MIDVVIPLGKGSIWKDNELRYCLRSLEKNLLDLRDIWLIGCKPEWVQNVKHIYVEDIFRQNKDANLINKVLVACKEVDLSTNFVRLSDDQILLKPIKSTDFKFLYEDLLEDTIESWGNEVRNRWRCRVYNTYLKLREEKKTLYNFESHAPMIVEKDDFISIINRYRWDEEGGGYTINSLYFNNLKIDIEKVDSYKTTLYMYKSKEEIFSSIEDKLFLGYNNSGLNDDLKFVLETIFPNKSKYEK